MLASKAKLSTTYRPQSPYPTVARDLNLIVAESVRWADLAATVRSTVAALVQNQGTDLGFVGAATRLDLAYAKSRRVAAPTKDPTGLSDSALGNRRATGGRPI